MLKDLYVNLLASLIWATLGFLIALIGRFIFLVVPSKRLWSLTKPEKLIICTATVKNDTGKYVRPSTGIGQVRAIAYLITSINKDYKKIDVRRLLLSTEEIKQKIEHDIITLGGPKNNEISELFFKKIDSLNIVLQSIEGYIYWQKTNQIYKGVIENGEVIKDYGLIIKMDNPFCSTDKKTKFILFAGNHTYGTVAAAKYFTETLRKNRSLRKSRNIFAIVSCDVIDGYPVAIKLEDYFVLR